MAGDGGEPVSGAGRLGRLRSLLREGEEGEPSVAVGLLDRTDVPVTVVG